jgi:hypothetical protein
VSPGAAVMISNKASAVVGRGPFCLSRGMKHQANFGAKKGFPYKRLLQLKKSSA